MGFLPKDLGRFLNEVLLFFKFAVFGSSIPLHRLKKVLKFNRICLYYIAEFY